MTMEGMCWVCAAVCKHRGCRDSGMGAELTALVSQRWGKGDG